VDDLPQVFDVGAVRAATPVSNWTRAGGTELHALVWERAGGPGDVVCVHGLGVSHRYWVRMAQRLAVERSVFAPDLPGFGRSRDVAPARDIHELAVALGEWLTAKGLREVVLIGNSMGCQVIVDLAMHAPDLVGAAVLISPTFDPWVGGAGAQIARFFRDFPHERPALAPIVVRDYLECGPRRLAATFRLAIKDDVVQKLPLVQSPTLVIRGERGPIVSERWGRQASALLPSGAYAVIANTGHAVHFSAPDEVARTISTFLAERT
jgi:pimeloyl-ACP methyl ester carboxylesterase